jgi:hypothetical protein
MPQRRAEIADRIRQRIVAGLHLGVMREGDRLPSVRALAMEIVADPRVVLLHRAYEPGGGAWPTEPVRRQPPYRSLIAPRGNAGGP